MGDLPQLGLEPMATSEQGAALRGVQLANPVVCLEVTGRPSGVGDDAGWGHGKLGSDQAERTIGETGLRRSFDVFDEGATETGRLRLGDGDGSDDDGTRNVSHHQLLHVRRCPQHHVNWRDYCTGSECVPVFYDDGPSVDSNIL